MRKEILTIFLPLLFFVSTTLSAQVKDTAPKPLSFLTTVGVGIPMSKPSSMPLIWQAVVHYGLSDRFSAGAGTGLSFYEKMLMPVFADIRYNLCRNRRLTPFAGVSTGYAFAMEDNSNGGFYLNPLLGIMYTLRSGLKFQFSVGYELQELERLKRDTDAHFAKEFCEALSHNSISVKVGIVF